MSNQLLKNLQKDIDYMITLNNRSMEIKRVQLASYESGMRQATSDMEAVISRFIKEHEVKK